jgi:uncharacterized protein (DUF433 family)
MNLPEFLVEVPYDDIRMKGSRISLYHVVYLYKEGYSPERLHEEYPTLSVELIQKVIDFYLHNRAEVDAFVARYEAAIARLEADPSKRFDLEELLRRRLDLARLRKP